MPHEPAIKVGLVVIAAVAVLAAGLLLIGTEEKLFVRKNHYYVRFDDVGGLSPGNAVELNGVNVGKVEKIVLPENPASAEVDVWVEIDRRYARRLRAPAAGTAPVAAPAPAGAPMVSPAPAGTPVAGPAPAAPASPAPVTKAEIKTQGMLGDKYIALNLGSEHYPSIPEKGEIAAAKPLSVDALMGAGGEVMVQVKQVVQDLKTFTGSLNKNGSLVNRLVADQDYGREVSAKLSSTLDNLSKVSGKLASGQGTLGKLIDDPGVYNGLKDVVVGVNQNKALRWLVQNRQQAGMAKRNQDAAAAQKQAGGGASAQAQKNAARPQAPPP